MARRAGANAVMAHNLSERQLRARIERFFPGWNAPDSELAESVIHLFNVRLAGGRGLVFSPTVGAALLCGYHWLHVFCHGCGHAKAIDLSVVRRPPDMAITDIPEKLRCVDCNGMNALPFILRLAASHR